MSKKYFALDLYGGKEAVIGRMAPLIQEEMKKYPGGLQELSEESGVPIETLAQIKEGNGQEVVDFNLFETLGCFFGLSIHDALGEPDLSDPKIRKYWIDQMKKNPMLIVGTPPS